MISHSDQTPPMGIPNIWKEHNELMAQAARWFNEAGYAMRHGRRIAADQIASLASECVRKARGLMDV